MSRPAAAGPKIRVRFIPPIWSEIAFISRCCGTSCGTIACRAGMFTAKTAPTPSAPATRCQYSIHPPSTSTATTRSEAAAMLCVRMSSRLLSTRSATTPPKGATTSIGTAIATAIAASETAFPVRSKAR